MNNDERQGLPSASGASKWYNCPGSPIAEIGCPESAETLVSQEGDVIHLAMETGQREGLGYIASDIVERLDAIKKAAVEDWHIAFGLNPANTQVGKEERFWVYGPDDKKITSAKLDTFYINGKHSLVIDFKSGFLHATKAAVNAQLKIQALALWGTYENLEHIRVAIAQCRFHAHYDPCDYKLDYLHMAYQEMLLVDWRSKQPDAPRFAGSWCNYCRAKQAGVCHEAAAYAMMPLVQTSTFEAPSKSAKASALDKVNQLSLPQLAFIHNRSSLTRSILDAVNDRLKTCDNDALMDVGLQKGEPGKKREVHDFQKLFDILFTNKLTTLDEFKTWVVVGLGDMEEVCIDRLHTQRGITKKAAKEVLATITEPAITFTPSEPRLKSLKD